MIISVYHISTNVYEVVKEGNAAPVAFEKLLAIGEHPAVMVEIQNQLASTGLDIAADAEFVPLNEEGGTTAIDTENTWLLQEVEPAQRARIIKNPDGHTETQLRTWKGSLPLVVNALYAYIEELDAGA